MIEKTKDRYQDIKQQGLQLYDEITKLEHEFEKSSPKP